MIAPHDQPVRRNDPCPCGSGAKYKKCCMGTGTEHLPRLEPDDMKVLLYAAVLQLQRLTHSPFFAIPEHVFDDERMRQLTLNIDYDPTMKVWRFRVDAPELKKQIVQPSRRILFPNA